MTTVIGQALAWWAASSVVAVAAAPIARTLMPTLPDRGLAFARPLGLLLVGYTWWILVTAGVLPNSRFGVVAALLIVAACGAALVYGDPAAWWAELRARRRLIIGLESLYVVALVLWALYRAFYPDITESGGEKMMEMAFLSGIHKSPLFPPNDPWLSGHSISYYYFGYLIAVLLIKLTGLSRFVAYNLVVPMTWAMTLSAAFSLGWSLAVLTPGTTRRLRIVAGAVTATMLGIAGSLAGFLELAFMRGWLPARAFDFMNIRNLTVHADACGEPGSGYGMGGIFPSRFMWWWRTSRIIRDGCKDVIQEFPFFSFLLADVHPHVMALPYALLALGLGLALLLGASERWPGARLRGAVWLLLPLCVGALGFLNTWDLPTYGLVVGACWTLWRLKQPGGGADAWRETVVFGVWLLGLAIVAYLPFYAAFSSQAAGIGIARASSRLDQWSVHFLPLVFLAGTVIGVRLWVSGRSETRIAVAGSVPLVALAVVAWGRLAPRPAEAVAEAQWTPWTPFVVVLPAVLALIALADVWRRRGPDEGRLARDAADGASDDGVHEAAASDGSRAGKPIDPGRAAEAFALLCVAVGLAMAAVPEFIYLKDVFNDRMNTVFKFFFQAWVLLSVGGGYAVTAVGSRAWRRTVGRTRRVPTGKAVAGAAWTAVAVCVAAMVLYTPVAAVFNRTDGLRWTTLKGNGFAAWSAGLQLDGLKYWEQANADDLAAGLWLDAHATGTPNIIEFPGGGYDRAGRIAMITGFPTVLGADGHESQWRGTRAEIDPRMADIEAFYVRMPAPEMEATLKRFDARYVIVGARERERSAERQLALAPDLGAKLATFMTPVFRAGQTTVWAVKTSE